MKPVPPTEQQGRCMRDLGMWKQRVCSSQKRLPHPETQDVEGFLPSRNPVAIG